MNNRNGLHEGGIQRPNGDEEKLMHTKKNIFALVTVILLATASLLITGCVIIGG